MPAAPSGRGQEECTPEAAFNARPFGMLVAPNWVGLAAAGLLGLADPGFWVLGAGLELGYLLVLATNERFRRTVTAAQISNASPGDNWTARIGKALLALGERDRLRYQTIAERCRSIIDLQEKQLSSGPVGLGLESQPDGLARLAWMYLRLLLMRHAIQKVQEDTAAAKDLPGAIALLEGHSLSSPEGIPRGRRFPFAFGIDTLRAGLKA